MSDRRRGVAPLLISAWTLFARFLPLRKRVDTKEPGVVDVGKGTGVDADRTGFVDGGKGTGVDGCR